jgi:hypothetical protein
MDNVFVVVADKKREKQKNPFSVKYSQLQNSKIVGQRQISPDIRRDSEFSVSDSEPIPSKRELMNTQALKSEIRLKQELSKENSVDYSEGSVYSKGSD